MEKSVAIVLFIVIIAVFCFGVFKIGPFGIVLNNVLSFLLGNYYFFCLFTFMFFLIQILFEANKLELKTSNIIGIVLLNLAVIMLSAFMFPSTVKDSTLINNLFENLKYILSDTVNYGGGLIGTSLFVFFVKLFNIAGAIMVEVLLFVLSLILIVPLHYFKSFFDKSKDALDYAHDSLDDALKEREIKKKEEEIRRKTLEEKKVIDSLNGQFNIMSDGDKSLDSLYIDYPKKETAEEKDEFISSYQGEFFLSADKTPVKEEVVPDNSKTADFIFSEPQIKPEPEPAVKEEVKETEPVIEKPKVLKKDTFKNYRLPNSKQLLLSSINSNSTKNKTSAQIKGRKLIEILSKFGIKAELLDIHIGPSVTKFEIRPDSGVNLSRFHSISDNIKMELAARDIRIEAPIPGKNAVGVEVPNAENTMVRMSELINKVPQEKRNSKLLFTLGKDLLGQPVFCELNKMPHLLIAGATGSGKSVCINTIITSFLLRVKPDEVKLVLVDPKKVEFTPYHDIPHLLWPVITDPKMASFMLKKIVIIMEDRYNLFAEMGAREINVYNQKVEDYNKNLKEGEAPMEKLPFIVVIIDELADLMQVAGKEVEGSIQRITQLARASGIHLIVATQRPSTDVITGLIKSNIPSRISFAVSSSIDSRTILDATGAERLLGNGDMLYSPSGQNAPTRLQGCYVTDDEIKNVTEFCKSQAHPDYDDTYFAIKNNESGGSGGNAAQDDDLYEEAVEFVATTKKASTSSLQRRFGIGYNRAARLIDTMEENGLIGTANGSKPREVYVKAKGSE